MSKDGRIWFSHTGIENLERCPRCFWLQYNKGIYQPEGIVSRLANRFDKVLKNYFNIYRPLGELPPMVKDKLDGKLENPFQEKYFFRVNEKYGFLGKLDECIINHQGEYIPIDFKTASSDPRDKETLSAYQSQIDDYIFLLDKEGKKVAGFGYLIYFFPDEGKLLHDGFPMIIHLVKLNGDPTKTTKRISHAIEVVERTIPQPSDNCPFCNWYTRVKDQIDAPIPKAKKATKYFQDKLI